MITIILPLVIIAIVSCIVGYCFSITNGMSLFAVLLAALTFWFQWIQRPFFIKLEMKLHPGKGFYEIKAVNKSLSDIYLDKIGIEFPTKEIPPYIFRMDSTFIEKKEKLLEKQNNVINIVDTRYIADYLRERDQSGTIIIRGFVQDKTGKKYYSKKIQFDIDINKPVSLTERGIY